MCRKLNLWHTKTPSRDIDGVLKGETVRKRERNLSRPLYHEVIDLKRTAIYLRVSTDRQAQEGDSIAAQRDALRRYIDDHDNLIFAGEYMDDGVSGTKYSQRDELQHLLDDVRAGKIDLLIFTKLDRFFRSIRWYTSTQALLDKYNVQWAAIWEPIYDTTTPQGRLIVNQMMSIAQFEAENTGQRIRQVNAYKVAQGEVITGSCPHGYTIKDKHLVPDQYAPNVLLAFETFNRLGSLNGTMMEMAGMEGLPRGQHGFRNMLRNPIYVGEYRENTNYCEPIIPRQLWEHVQVLLSRNIKANQRETYLFGGLILCAECGRRFGSLTRRRGDRATHMYRCKKHYYNRPAQCTNTKVLFEAPLERYLVNNLSELINKVVVEYEEAKPKDNSARIAAAERKIERLKDLYVNDLITLDEYKTDKTALIAQISDLKAESIKPSIESINELKALNNKDFACIYETLTAQERRQFWRGIVKEIRFDKDRNIEVVFL